MMYGYHGGLGGLGMLFCGILGLVVLVGLLLLIVWGVRRMSGGTNFANQVPLAPGQPTPKEILQARYASGEITREQYKEMLEDLGK
ncbi:MAG TPA: SHOCT domain-containing protein [Longilinea sp.]|nr:SHOCT domain-containing protein [Longilinea sp.]